MVIKRLGFRMGIGSPENLNKKFLHYLMLRALFKGLEIFKDDIFYSIK